MTTGEEEIFARLHTNNPFSSNAAGDPRTARYPDVPGLGDDVFHGLQILFAQKKQHPDKPCAAAVLGEAGSGKTHLIGRLIEQSQSAPFPYSCAYILPFIDAGQGFRYLLREIINNLTHTYTMGAKYSQFDFLVGKITISLLISAANEAGSENILQRVLKFQSAPPEILNRRFIPKYMQALMVRYGADFLLKHNAELHPTFIKVLLQYCFDKTKRTAAEQWLMGRVTDARHNRLLDVRDRYAKTHFELEQEAQEILISLDILLNLYGRPLIIFFDQLENLHDDEQIRKFQSMVFFLSDIRKAMLPVAFFRAQDWERKFKLKFDDFCSGRFKANIFDLKGCSRRQSIELIRARLRFASDSVETPNDMYPFYPGYEDKLHRMLRAHEMHPRQVINRANRLLHEILHHHAPNVQTPEQILKKALELRFEEISADFDRYPPDEARLALALELYLNNRPDIYPYHITDIAQSSGQAKFLLLSGNITLPRRKMIPVAFIIDTETHHNSVAASIRRGIEFLENRPDAKAAYIRDSRCPFRGPSHWKKNNILLETFLKSGGVALFLNELHAAYWYALTRLQFDIQAGDISAPGFGVIRFNHLKDFMASSVDGDTYPAFKAIDRYLASENRTKEEVIPTVR